MAAAAQGQYAIEKATSDDASRASLVVLRDDKAKVEAAIAPSKGGELTSLRVHHKGKWIETIYLARDYSPRADWTGKAPLLWPATGQNMPADLLKRRAAGEQINQGAWEHDGKRYPMPGHGFARDSPWKLESSEAGSDSARARLSFVDSDVTRKYYPFGFHLSVEYELKGGALAISYRVHADAANRGEMPFSIGNHITFNTPLVTGGDAGKMVFISPSKTRLIRGDNGVPTGESEPRFHGDGIALGDFERRIPISLSGYQGEPWMELRDPQGLTIRMSHKASSIPEQPVILFNVWGDPPDGYFSPEPWVGLQNSLVLQEGITRLEPGDDFDWTIRVEVIRRPDSVK